MITQSRVTLSTKDYAARRLEATPLGPDAHETIRSLADGLSFTRTQRTKAQSRGGGRRRRRTLHRPNRSHETTRRYCRNPLLPSRKAGSSLQGSNTARSTRTITSWAMRSPRLTWNVCSGSRFTSTALIFATVVAVDEAGSVHQRNSVLDGQATPGNHQAGTAKRDRHGYAARHERPLERSQFQVAGGAQIDTGVADISACRNRQVGIKPHERYRQASPCQRNPSSAAANSSTFWKSLYTLAKRT